MGRNQGIVTLDKVVIGSIPAFYLINRLRRKIPGTASLNISVKELYKPSAVELLQGLIDLTH